MQRFRQWLATSVQAVKQGAFGPAEANSDKLRIVMGNTSCDVDSAIGALVLAHYYNVKYSQQWIPVINCRREDFLVNLEITLHLEKCGIPHDQLYFYDEFRAQYPDPEAVDEVALVDHNLLDKDQSDLGSKVTRVVDHHIDSGAYAEQLKEKQCHLVGSACSLVAIMIKADEALFAEDNERMEPGQPANLAYLLGAAVVLDSYFFKEELRGKKWTEQDTEAYEFLMQYADISHDYWSALNDIKFNVQAGLGLGLKGIFIRDFKQYDLESGMMGVSVSTGTIDTVLDHFGSEPFGAACKAYCLEKNLGLFVIIAIQADHDGNVQKNILIFECDQNPVEQALKSKGAALRGLIEGTEDMALHDKKELSMEQLGGAGVATYYVIGNNRYSRKAYEAIVKSDPNWQKA